MLIERNTRPSASVILAFGALLACPTLAQQSSENLARQLANPISALISVPFQFNYDQDVGRRGMASASS